MNKEHHRISVKDLLARQSSSGLSNEVPKISSEDETQPELSLEESNSSRPNRVSAKRLIELTRQLNEL